MDIDISNPPERDIAPVELYETVRPDEDDFEISAYDIGVIMTPIEKDVPIPDDVVKRAATPRKSRARKEVLPDSEFIEPVMELPDRISKTVVGRLARVIHEKIEFPEVSSFLSLLGSAACATSMFYQTQYVTSSPVAMGLYVIVEQPPAMMKSYLLDIGMNPYRMAVGEHNKKVGGKNREIQERGGDDSSLLKRTFSDTSDGTSASIDGFLSGCAEGRFVVSSAEQSGLISLFPETGSFSSTNELILKGYVSEYVSGMRSGRKAFVGMVQGCVVIIAQPGSSKRVLSASGGSGMAERFIYVAEPDPIGFRRNDGAFPTHAECGPFSAAIEKCVKDYSAVALDQASVPEDQRVIMQPGSLTTVRATDGGYRILREAKNSTEGYLYELKMAGEMVMMGWVAKLETHVLKIAANIHVIECLANNCKVSEVIPDWLIEESIDLVLMLGEHIKGILNSAGESGANAEEETIVDILSAKPMERRALILKAKNRKPFKSMPAGFKIANARVDAMISSGQLSVSTAGKIEIV